MFTYATKKNRYGDEHIAVSANGAEIATIKPSSYYGNTEYIVSTTVPNSAAADLRRLPSFDNSGFYPTHPAPTLDK